MKPGASFKRASPANRAHVNSTLIVIKGIRAGEEQHERKRILWLYKSVGRGKSGCKCSTKSNRYFFLELQQDYKI